MTLILPILPPCVLLNYPMILQQRELVSKMLSAAYPDVLSSREVCKGFERLFEMIDDIQLDAPK